MRHYSCRLHFGYSSESVKTLLTQALKVPGFTPGIMNINITDEGRLDDISYDESFLFTQLSKNFTTIWIKNKMYDESDDYYWFRLEVDEGYNILRMLWHNSNLDFLLESELMRNFLNSTDFICGNCCDNSDRFEQSIEQVEHFINKDPKKPYDVSKIEQKVDVSQHWGRSVQTCGVEFIAAPLMWFGERFNSVIPKDKLLQFKYSNYDSIGSNSMVTIRLFDLYDLPEKTENRNRQEEFWKYFNLESVIKEYKSRNEIDPAKALNILLGRGKKGK